MRVEAGKSKESVSSDHLETAALQQAHLDDVDVSEHQLHMDSDAPMSPQHSTFPSSTLKNAHCSCCPDDSDKGSDDRTRLDHTQTDSALFTQMELLHQECQEKEALINKLSKQLADWEVLHAQFQENEKLNHQYLEALQAAESTIAYLTACNLGSQGGFSPHTNSYTGPDSVGSDAALYHKCMELQKGLQEKEELNHHLIELLNMSEKVIASPDFQEKNPETSVLCSRIEMALEQVNASLHRQSPRGGFETTEKTIQGLQHADSLQEALLDQTRLNVEPQEKLSTVAAAPQHRHESNNAHQNGRYSRQMAAKEQQLEMGGPDNVSLNQEVTKVLMKCLSAAESAVASLTAHCTNICSLASGRSSQASPDMQMNLDKLQRALQERKELGDPTQSFTKSSSNQGELHQELHCNLCQLYKVFSDNCQRISELQASIQEEKCHREEIKDHSTMPDGKGLPPSVQVQLETLHKALREKKKACKSLEEKLATALTNTSSLDNAQKGEIMHFEVQSFFF